MQNASAENGARLILMVAVITAAAHHDAAHKEQLMNNIEELSKPVAEVNSKYGDPEAFGERKLNVLADIQKMPYQTKFYSQEYVDALIAQLAAAEAQIKDMKEVLRGIHNTAIDPYGSRAGIAIAAKRAVLGDTYAE